MLKFRSIHHVDQETIGGMYETYSPVLILSTGRSGSKFIAKLLDLASNVTAYHEPVPTLQYFSNYAFHHQKEEEILVNMIDAARMELILEVFIKNKIFVESNQCLTFFAPLIAKLFKKSKFIHLVRHPGDFVRSAVRKGWYKNDSIWESGRVKMADKNVWAKMDQIEKLSWTWNTTNRFIEEFKCRIGGERVFDLRIEDLSGKNDKINEIMQFVGAQGFHWEKIKELKKKRINKFRIGPDEPPNIKKIYDVPEYTEWDEEKKNRLKSILKDLAIRYKYDL
jgi:hypothetical protein